MISRFPMMKTILSDRQPSLLSEVMNCVLKVFKVKKLSTSLGRPLCDGKAEGCIREILNTIKVNMQNTDDWTDILDLSLYAMRTKISDRSHLVQLNSCMESVTIQHWIGI